MNNNGVSGLGCALVDYLYPDTDFASPQVKPLQSVSRFDGGLIPGGLVFTDDLERFSGLSVEKLLPMISGGTSYRTVNLGGPAAVAMVHCSQMLEGLPVDVAFYGRMGNDTGADTIRSILSGMPLDWSNYLSVPGETPCTHVFSDPRYDAGRGERMFLNSIGVAGQYSVEDVPDSFFDSRIHLFAATALLPEVHDHLDTILRKGREKRGINIVTTVYDFRNASRYPGKRWSMGRNDDTWQLIDCLITDREEALNLSGATTIDDAMRFFSDMGVSTSIITHGPQPVHLKSTGGVFGAAEYTQLSVCDFTGDNKATAGDTTGCGDNFAGGVLASVAYQLYMLKRPVVDLTTAVAWGIASGGFACSYLGGTYAETSSGEKRERVSAALERYLGQQLRSIEAVHGEFHIPER